MSRLTLFCTLVLVLALSVPAYAAVQNVKVSGDLTFRAIYRDQYDLKDNDDANSEVDEYLTQQLGINVDADLTDNVSTQVRIVNERDWEVANDTTNLDLGVDLANVTLKELFYSPLTVIVGRQDVVYGRGFIVGSALLTGFADPEGSLGANEYTDYTAFDAIRAILDYDPWTIDMIWAKIDENGLASEDDIDLYGINVGYQFEDYNAEAELYLFVKEDRSTIVNGGNGDNGEADPATNTVYTLGTRGSMEPIENLSIWGEVAFQFGDYSIAADVDDAGSEYVDRDRQAWALDIGAEYNWADTNWTPSLGGEYIYFSGEAYDATNGAAGCGDYEGWDPMYRGSFTSAIRDFQTTLYATNDPNDQAATTNQHEFSLFGSIRPIDDLALTARWNYYRADEAYFTDRDEEIGHEIDLQAIYDYTEDVQVGLLAAWFIPGDYYDGETTEANKGNDTAFDLVGTMKVTF
ncbi:MAG: hypothetical protein JW844_02540 [Candidatus Omnitrophica bacterium]|nr:hypothetical protein [Candidatus Omnitrophota bacterium]